MSKLNPEDLQMLYWHATTKMRQGAFRSGAQFFNYVFNENPNFHTGLALAYCLYREKNLERAHTILQKINPISDKDQRFYERLLQRVERLK